MLELACGSCTDQMLGEFGPQLFYWLLAFLLWALPGGVAAAVYAGVQGRRLPVPHFRYLVGLFVLSLGLGGSVFLATAVVLAVWVPRLARSAAEGAEVHGFPARLNRAFLLALLLLGPVAVVRIHLQLGSALPYSGLSTSGLIGSGLVAEAALAGLTVWGWRGARRGLRPARAWVHRRRRRTAEVEVQEVQACPLCRCAVFTEEADLAALRLCLVCGSVVHAGCEGELGGCCGRAQRRSVALDAGTVVRRSGPRRLETPVLTGAPAPLAYTGSAGSASGGGKRTSVLQETSRARGPSSSSEGALHQ